MPKKKAAVKKKAVAKKKPVVVQDVHVAGDKKNGIDSLTNKKGFFNDKYGNTIYRTDSKENQDRLKALKAE